MKVYYSYEESGIDEIDNKIYTFLKALKEGFKKHMELFKDRIEKENGFFVIKVNKDFEGGMELYQFSKELHEEMIPYVDKFNDDGHIIRIYLTLFPKG